QDIFVQKLDTNGSFLWARRVGGTGAEQIGSISTDASKNIYLTGYFTGTADFDPGTATNNLTSSGAADIFILKIKQCDNTTSTLNDSACYEFLSPSGKLWTSSGIYKGTIPNKSRCDSLITINLIITSRDSIQINVCSEYNSPSGKYLWNSSGTYIDTVNKATGCDSLYVVELTILETQSEQFIIACDSFVSPSSNHIYFTSGIYNDTLLNSNNCDSILKINLTIHNSYSTRDTIIRCDDYLSPSGKFLWTSSNDYLDTLLSVEGCDSILVIHLIINYSDSINQTISSCDSIISPSGKYIWRFSGNYTDTLSNSDGCDSILFINLSINSSYYSHRTDSICVGDSSFIFGFYRKMNGTFYDSLQTIMGCDSIMSVTLRIDSNYNITQNLSICIGDSILLYGIYQNTAGIYVDSSQSIKGCDSVSSTVLSIGLMYSISQSLNLCQGDSLFLGGNYIKSSGVYIDNLLSKHGCDSTVTTTVSLYNTYSAHQGNNSICVGDSFLIYGIYRTINGTYYDTLQTINGCDSIFSMNLTVNTITSSTTLKTICRGDSMLIGGVYRSVVGRYTDSLLNKNGCDSIVNINLRFTPLDLTVQNNSPILIANSISVSYQWIDCNNGNAPIAGETNQSFVATSNGNYAVEMTKFSCIDTSSCYSVVIVGVIENNFNNELILFPNPTNGDFSIDLGKTYSSITITISDVGGKLIQSNSYSDSQLLNLKIEEPAGGYLLMIESAGKKAVLRLIKE
ncbi:MAG: T9SS type A sorting domain-containing protein, partial [Flavobacteriales bacterium]|nr:T9SS type A sorting domain-containing protein [Flavobacteriales bacterium]